jgi:hypothetical protein
MNTKESKVWGAKLASVLGTTIEKGTREGKREETLCLEEGEELLTRGGPGSGHFGHAGRPGAVGGSVEGGVQAGRAEAPESPEHFKWSGKFEMKRKAGPGVNLSIIKDPRQRHFEVHGAADAKGKPKRGKAVIRTNGDTIELDHDELHDLRSKMRYVQMTNTRDIQEIAGREIVRGNTIEVEHKGKTVRIPVNEDTVREIDRASHASKKEGFSFTGESKREIHRAYDKMSRGNPIHIVKDMGFSKAGKFAAFRAYVDGPKRSKKDVDRLVESKRGVVSKSTVQALRRTAKQFFETRKSGWDARDGRSATDAMKHYQKAAALFSRIEKSGERKRR